MSRPRVASRVAWDDYTDSAPFGDPHYVAWNASRAAYLRTLDWQGKRVFMVGAGGGNLAALLWELGAAVVASEPRECNRAHIQKKLCLPAYHGLLKDTHRLSFVRASAVFSHQRVGNFCLAVVHAQVAQIRPRVLPDHVVYSDVLLPRV